MIPAQTDFVVGEFGLLGEFIAYQSDRDTQQANNLFIVGAYSEA